ncbi:hypothetical protein Mapa_008302 [Marchantia paleacea]|nr:hypothetical protein Mapa_008302 [Marchantia paleacea]
MVVPAVKAAAAAAAKAAKSGAAKAAPKVPKAPGAPSTQGLTKVVTVSPALKKFVGTAEISRTETMKKLWAYIKDKNLQDPAAKREIVCDETLKQLFPERERINFLEIPRLLSAHFPKKGQS